MAQQPNIGPWPLILQASRHVMLCGEKLSAPRLTPKLEDQVSVLMPPPRDRVAQLYPLALGSPGPYGSHLPYSH